MAKMTLPPLLILILGLSIATQYCSAGDVLLSPEALYSYQSLTNGPYRLTMQNDCNLVLYAFEIAIWASNTVAPGYDCRCVMQSDGNLVVYNRQNNRPVWVSGTHGADGNYALVLQKDRNVVIYGSARWSTGTHKRSHGVAVVAVQNSTTAAAAAAAGEVIADVGASDAR